MSTAAANVPMPPEEPRGDDIVVLRGATWQDLLRLLEVRGDHGVPRFHYLDGELQIMSPSDPHERIKSLLGCLVEAYCLERGVDFFTVGSWTIRDRAAQAAAEPDECWVFGQAFPEGDGGRPDLAIEVEWSRGALRKLEIYRRLRVREVWIWRRGVVVPHVLGEAAYAEVEASAVLSGIDLAQLAAAVDLQPPTSAVIRAYRAALAGSA
jgi:Uma2 family endonuclease